MKSYINAIRKYAVFSGRATRKEFWSFVLLNFVFYYLSWTADIFIGWPQSREPGYMGVVATTFTLAIIIPTLATSVRRLHDTNRGGWWVLVGLIPIVSIVYLVFMMLPSQSGTNQFDSIPEAQNLAR